MGVTVLARWFHARPQGHAREEFLGPVLLQRIQRGLARRSRDSGLALKFAPAAASRHELSSALEPRLARALQAALAPGSGEQQLRKVALALAPPNGRLGCVVENQIQERSPLLTARMERPSGRELTALARVARARAAARSRAGWAH